jgi:uncharacterized protein YgiM (DUF1202 family)
MGESARVIKSYRSEYPDPLKLTQGESVTLEPRECEWPGWLWATDREGKTGWIPEAYVSVTDATGELLRDYDATELDAEAGDTVEVLEQESGWARCKKADGVTGWLPLDVLK